MALKTTVKVTINNLSDARYCAGMGVDLIGFSTDPGDTFYLSPENFKEIAGWISGVDFVAEIDGNELSPAYDIDMVQVSNPDQAEAFSEKKVILKGNLTDLRKWKEQLKNISNLSFLLLDIDNSKNKIDEAIEEFEEFALLIGFDLAIDDVQMIASSKATGIALKGSDEISPGLKDYDELADILEALEVDSPY